MSLHAKAMASKANRARHGPRVLVLTKERAWNVRAMEKSKGQSKGSKSAKGSYKG